MIRFMRLFLLRLLIFALVSSLAYFTVFKLFPYIDDRLPWLVAILICYCFVAYFGIPTAIRIFRIFDRPNHIPIYSVTGDGWPSDPVNIAVLAATKKDFVRAMRKAGWYVADQNSLRNNLREAYAILFNRPYPKAPFSKLYLFGRKQDLGFQIPVGKSPRLRHHVRFWQVTHESLLDLDDNHPEHKTFWQQLFRRFWQPEMQLWVGCAIYDAGAVAIRWRNGQITHEVHPDANFERDFMVRSLKEARVLKIVSNLKAGEPYRERGQAFGTIIISDGFVQLCTIKRQILPAGFRARAVKSSQILKRSRSSVRL